MAGIEGIITGYEHRFDFPAWAGLPPVPYLLASVPRAGSTWLSHQLWASGCLGAPLEYCNFEPGGPGEAATGEPSAQIAIWHRSLGFRTSPNGVYGLKVFPTMLHQLEAENPALLGEVMRTMVGPGSPRKVVRLRRRDRDAHAISYARASLSGIWRREQEEQGEGIEPDFSAVAVERCRHAIAHQEAAWDAMCADLRIAALELWFEDALANPQAAVQQVCDYLGVEFDPATAIAVPAIRQQATGAAREWARRLAEG
jgi:trehalose 2-sulfotransferase